MGLKESQNRYQQGITQIFFFLIIMLMVKWSWKSRRGKERKEELTYMFTNSET